MRYMSYPFTDYFYRSRFCSGVAVLTEFFSAKRGDPHRAAPIKQSMTGVAGQGHRVICFDCSRNVDAKIEILIVAHAKTILGKVRMREGNDPRQKIVGLALGWQHSG